MNTKVCTSCDTEKLETEFHYATKEKIRRRGDCRSCVAEKYKLRKASDPKRHKTNHRYAIIKHKYGLSRKEVDELLVAQGEACAICNKAIDLSAHVDHCHSSGRVRGLLCSYCNKGLGLFRDNPEALIRAAQYLKET